MDRPWTSGFDKRPVVGPVRLGVTNLSGDGQADLVHHGGPDKAILAYSADHYDGWRHELKMTDLAFGAFGENFTIARLTEANVCLGDIWQVGNAVLQISQPRQPCWKLARRWRIKTLALQVQESGRTGWYFRVLQEGIVATGMPLQQLERVHPDWTVERANHVMHSDKDNVNLAAALAAIPPLAASWKVTLTKRVEQNIQSDPAKRLLGPNEP
jgi:MOSC domain-containing protein YiiM